MPTFRSLGFLGHIVAGVVKGLHWRVKDLWFLRLPVMVIMSDPAYELIVLADVRCPEHGLANGLG